MAVINRDKQFFYSTIAMVIVGAVISFGFRFYGERISSFFGERNVGIETVLREMAEFMNNEAPQIFDDGVLFIGAYFRSGERTIVHKAMLLHHSKDDLDLQDFKEGVTEYLIADLETAEDVAIFRDQNVIFEYVYFDNQGAEVFRVRLLLNTPITVAGSVNR